MKGYPLVFLAFLLLGNVSASDTERDVGCGPGVYCGDSPDDDGDPCTPQPDDPRTPDYDEGADDVPCEQPLTVSVGEARVEAWEVVAAGFDLDGRTVWME